MDLSTFATASIIVGIISFFIILVDVIRKPQAMGIMDIVWPVTGLYAGPLALLAYFFIGRKSAGKMKMNENDSNMNMPSGGMNMAGNEQTHQPKAKPFWQSVLVGALHCGSGCTIGDFLAEGFLWIFPVSFLGSSLYGGWAIDFVFAFFIGIVFQYFAIKPMGKLSTKQALVAALKADTLSLISWQIGMYGWMAISIFILFHHRLSVSGPLFWFMMQIAMVIGLITAFPTNWWLIKKGIKEAM